MRPELDATDLAEARRWLEAARDDVVSDLLREVFAEVASVVAERRPVCTASGRCCQFEAYGHRLYVTGLEAAFTVDRLRRELSREVCEADIERAREAGGCCFQIDGLCSVHEIKPVACRTYYCDPTSAIWQTELTESSLDRLKRLHELHAIPYRYGEWRSMLSLVLAAEER
ncbi:MAG: hypothetical protein AAGK04_00735 [Planctomycetota bacterium]